MKLTSEDNSLAETVQEVCNGHVVCEQQRPFYYASLLVEVQDQCQPPTQICWKRLTNPVSMCWRSGFLPCGPCNTEVGGRKLPIMSSLICDLIPFQISIHWTNTFDCRYEGDKSADPWYQGLVEARHRGRDIQYKLEPPNLNMWSLLRLQQGRPWIWWRFYSIMFIGFLRHVFGHVHIKFLIRCFGFFLFCNIFVFLFIIICSQNLAHPLYIYVCETWIQGCVRSFE